MYYLTQPYGDEHKHLNSEEHKEEFEMQNVTVMDLSCIEMQIFQDHICCQCYACILNWLDFLLRKY